MSHNSHILNHRKHFNAVSDIDAAITLATISSNNVDNDYLTSLVSPSTPQMPPVNTIDDIAALTDISFITDSPKCKDEHVADKATGSGAGSYERKDSAATKPLPKNLPVVPKERHIPAHKKKTCALTFPERLMSMLDYAEEMKAKSDDPDNYCVTWLPKGDAFLIRDPKAYAETVIPKFFKAAKFSSFSRKLYRWGFHQIQREDADAAALPAGAIIFASEHFKRDARHEMANMRSTTAAGEKRKVDQIEGMGIFKEDSSSKAKIDVNVFGISGSAGQSSTASLSTSNLFIGSEQGRGSVSTMSDIMSKKPASRQPLKKRAIEKILPPSNHNAKFEDFTKIEKSNLFQNSTWGSVTGFNESSLPMLVPTSDQIVLNDQVSKFLTMMSQVGTHKVSLGPAQMDSSRNLSIERGLLISGQRNFIGGVSGRHPVMSLSSTHLQYKNNEHLIRLFRSAADALERTIV